MPTRRSTKSVLARPVTNGDRQLVEALREQGIASDAGLASRMTFWLL